MWRQFVFRALRRGGRAACSPLFLQLWRCRGAAAESPLARHRQFLGSRRQSSGPGAAGGGCCRTALGPDPRWRQSKRKQEVWRRGSPWAASDWREEGGGRSINDQGDSDGSVLHVELTSGSTWWNHQALQILINGLFLEVREHYCLDHNNTYIFTYIFFSPENYIFNLTFILKLWLTEISD